MNHVTELVFILDRSGSIAGLESDTLDGFHALLAKQKAIKAPCYVTTVLFNDHIDIVHDRIDVHDVGRMSEQDYRAGGCTALLDAIGFTQYRRKAPCLSDGDISLFL